MNAGTHPTIDQIADHEAGLLSADDAPWIVEHLADCEVCSETSERLAQVGALLRETGASTQPIPVEVAQRLDAALDIAAAERAAGVPSLSERRADRADPAGHPATPRRRGRWVIGAAAAIAVFAVGGAIATNGLPGSSTQDDTAARSSADQQQGAGSAESGGGGASAPSSAPSANDRSTDPNLEALRDKSLPSLDATSVATYAARLSAGSAARIPVPAAECGIPDLTAGSGAGPVTGLVRYDGHSAVLRVEPAQRRLTVYACPGPAQVLYRSSY